MPTWLRLYSHYNTSMQSLVGLMAMMWRQAASRNDEVLDSNLAINSYSVSSMAQQLDYAGIEPDTITLEWCRSQDGYPPPVPFFVVR